MDEANDLESKEDAFCIGFDFGVVFFFIAESNEISRMTSHCRLCLAFYFEKPCRAMLTDH